MSHATSGKRQSAIGKVEKVLRPSRRCLESETTRGRRRRGDRRILGFKRGGFNVEYGALYGVLRTADCSSALDVMLPALRHSVAAGRRCMPHLQPYLKRQRGILAKVANCHSQLAPGVVSSLAMFETDMISIITA